MKRPLTIGLKCIKNKACRQRVLGRDVPVEDNKWKDDVAPGDKVSFKHHANKKGQRGAFISVSKTAFN